MWLSPIRHTSVICGSARFKCVGHGVLQHNGVANGSQLRAHLLLCEPTTQVVVLEVDVIVFVTTVIMANVIGAEAAAVP